jgi:translocation and assembly module TamA
LVYRHYWSLKQSPRLVLAQRVAMGALWGAERKDIPADERFLSGGGGSVRGFAYQLVGELDEEKNPLGGRSLFEFANEVRYRIRENIGIVSFVDTGAVYPSSFPSFDSLQIGAGFGLRYITSIGPLRFDVAVPVNKRKGIDDSFQVYLSIGQAY